jgi:EAL domain-containing protein (putative c-di-GMP-specific phosphodiesterase class I)
VNTLLAPFHQIGGSQSDLLAFVRLWQWKCTVRERLPDVVAAGNLRMLFQPIFELKQELPQLCGYEALARFPVAPRIPVGLWFRVAHEMGLAHDLELVAVQKAAETFPRLPDDSLLFVNASLRTAIDLADQMPRHMRSRLVVDIPYTAMADPECRTVFDRLWEVGAEVAIDDVPVGDLHIVRTMLLTLRPDYVKADMITGLTDDPMARFNLAEAAVWCQESGITLIAERVGKVTDLAILHDLGVQWAQGYSLARPAEPDRWDRIIRLPVSDLVHR